MSASTDDAAPGSAQGPHGWEEHRDARGLLCCAPGWGEGLALLGYSAGAPARGPLAEGRPLGVGGRAQVRVLDHPRGAILLRTYQRGGLLRGLRGDRFPGPERALEEARLLAELREAGLPVVEPLSVRATRRGEGDWGLELGTRYEEGAEDLRSLLARARRGEALPYPPEALARAAGQLVRKAHDMGLDHVDLQPANLLLLPPGDGSAPRLLLLDLDRCVRSLPPRGGVPERNLARLERWLAGREEGRAVGQRERAAFLRAYEPDRMLRRALAAAVHTRLRSRRRFQVLGRGLERLLGLRRL
ncbi:MAG: hypothetical protein ISQ08_01435 [Planctomycetes bacterium]|nr:hypothetical protein [Planctomycetota bacterium]